MPVQRMHVSPLALLQQLLAVGLSAHTGAALASNANGFAPGIVRNPAPPMGWRSWNFFQCDINQDIMQAQMDALTLPRHGTSLLKLGYDHVGLDDCWQSCTGKGGGFHDVTGQPIVNTTLFPSLRGMVDHGHAQGVKVGFYQDNCRCHECKQHNQCWDVDAHYPEDANLTESLMFDGLKVDSCGNQRDMVEWAAEFAKPGRHDLMVESCGNGPKGIEPKRLLYSGSDYLGLPASWRTMLEDTCPFSFFRVSVDVAPQFFSTVYNLIRSLPYLQPTKPLSRPGCWAYPDMLEVGVHPMTYIESQTHFGMWAITSTPLILGFDLHDDKVVEANWRIIANEEVLSVSKTWAGHPGYLVKNSSDYFEAEIAHGAFATRGDNHSLPNYQVWAKPQLGGSLAVLVVNVCDAAHCGAGSHLNIAIPISELFHASLYPRGAPRRVSVRDLWGHRDLPDVATALKVSDVAPHGGKMVLLTPKE